VHQKLNLRFEKYKLQPAHSQKPTAHIKNPYRCFLPDLTGFEIKILRRAEKSTPLINNI